MIKRNKSTKRGAQLVRLGIHESRLFFEDTRPPNVTDICCQSRNQVLYEELFTKILVFAYCLEKYNIYFKTQKHKCSAVHAIASINQSHGILRD